MKTNHLYFASITLLLAIAVLSVTVASRSLRNTQATKQRHQLDEANEERRSSGMVDSSPADKSEKTDTVKIQVKPLTTTKSGVSFQSVRKLYAQKTAGAPEIPVGILSEKPDEFFRSRQIEVDEADPAERCRRYKGTYKSPGRNRRIFYGALAASEPWELLEIVAAETYGVFAGMVWVESNRTQNFTPRSFLRLDQVETLQQLFGVEYVAVVAHVNEDSSDVLERAAVTGRGGAVVDTIFLAREHSQRNDIVHAWKQQGMTGDDVGLLVDMDETFTRDFLRAVQQCDGIAALDYAVHHCNHKHVKLVAVTTTFETTPECITADRQGFHPDMIIGACIEGIGDSDVHPSAPREVGTFLRQPGFGGGDCDWSKASRVKDGKFPLWDMSDFRRTCGGGRLALDTDSYPDLAEYTAYHFHNFFADFNATRFKMKTYGHPNQHAMTRSLEHLSNDLKLMYRCVKDVADADNQKWRRVKGGFDAVKPFMPIYFQDEDYRRRRHAYVQQMVDLDDIYIRAHNGNIASIDARERRYSASGRRGGRP